MKKVLISLLIGTSLLGIGCTKKTEVIEPVKEEINYWDLAEEYNSAKEYKKGDIVYYEGKVEKYWAWNGLDCEAADATWDEGNEELVSVWDAVFGGEIKIVGEKSTNPYKSKYFIIKDIEIIDEYPPELEDYKTIRNAVSDNGISEEEATYLKKYSSMNKECEEYEKSLDNSIYDLY